MEICYYLFLGRYNMSNSKDDYNEKNIEVKALVSQKMIDDYQNNKTYQKNGLRSSNENKGSFASDQPEIIFEEQIQDSNESYVNNDDLKREQALLNLEQRELEYGMLDAEYKKQKAELVNNSLELGAAIVKFLAENPEIVVGAVKGIKTGVSAIKKTGKNIVSLFSKKTHKKVIIIENQDCTYSVTFKNGNKNNQTNETIELTEEQARIILKETILAYVKAHQGADILSKATIDGHRITNSDPDQVLERISDLKTQFPNLLDNDTKVAIVSYLELNDDKMINDKIKRKLFE